MVALLYIANLYTCTCPIGNLNSLVLVFSIVQEPVTIVLGSHLRYVGLGSKRRLIDTNDTFEYIPLLQGIKCLL